MTIENKTIIITKEGLESYRLAGTPSYDIGYYMQTDFSKDICEDALLVHTEDNIIILGVCDGVGSSKKSYRAAQAALESILNSKYNRISIKKALNECNEKLLLLSGEPQTTLTFVIIKDKR